MEVIIFKNDSFKKDEYLSFSCACLTKTSKESKLTACTCQCAAPNWKLTIGSYSGTTSNLSIRRYTPECVIIQAHVIPLVLLDSRCPDR